MPLDELTITLADSDGRVSVETLTKALENALDMLRGVESGFVSSSVTVRWEVVRAKMQSPLCLTIAPRGMGKTGKATGRKIVKACLQGMKEIERTASLPPFFNEDTLEATRKLVKNATSEGALLTFGSNGKEKVTLTDNTVRHIEEIVSKARLYVDFSTIEGHLEIVSIHEYLSFFVWETFTNNKIECHVTEDQFNESVKLLGKRVAVTGRVKYRNHIPRSIQVETVKVLRGMSELPQPSDIGSIDITEGKSSEEHVRRMRNG